MPVQTTTTGNETTLKSPYHPDLPAEAKKLGGRWDRASRTWRFDSRDEDRVRQLARTIYGTDGEPTETVTVKMILPAGETQGASLWKFGREIASRQSRDNPVTLGAGVVQIDGDFPRTGGSRKYPSIGRPKTAVVLEIRDVPVALASQAADEDDTISILEPVETETLTITLSGPALQALQTLRASTSSTDAEIVVAALKNAIETHRK